MQEENQNMNNSSNAIDALSGTDDDIVVTNKFSKPSLMLDTFSEKDRLDYLEKRARNNRAVRKSRSKRKDKYDTVSTNKLFLLVIEIFQLIKEATRTLAFNTWIRKQLVDIYKTGLVTIPDNSLIWKSSDAGSCLIIYIF